MENGATGMTADELRERLFVSFRNTGILASLKSQLRTSLVEHLAKHDDSLFGSTSKERPPLADRLIKSIFLEYLDSSGYTYTQSIFVPESHMESWPAFSHEEMVQLLRLDLTPLATGVEDKCSKKSCLALQLVAFAQQLSSSIKTANVSTQTDEAGPRKIDGWLQEIDENFRKRMEVVKCVPSHSLEERISLMYQDFDNRVRSEVDAQVSRVREFELERIRMEESAQYRRQLNIARQDWEDMQKTRLAQLSQREDSFMDRLLQKQKEVEFIAYQQRQKMLEDTEKLREREEKFTRTSEMQTKSLEQREEKVRLNETQLKLQKEDIEHLRDFLHLQSEEVISMKRSQLEKEHESLCKQLDMERGIFEEERARFRDEKNAFAADAATARSNKELVQALYRRLSTEEAQKKSLLARIDELETAVGEYATQRPI